ncbi:MAG: hypothetical protein KJ060_19710 [Candidatus Hydrogenedentes bacterium]|nr:hypothetical protein [Candidatus Hydrogenedentota bacterium]
MEWNCRAGLVGLLGVVVAMGGLAFFVTTRDAHAQSKVVRGERFELVDASGNVLAVLGPQHNGSPGLTLYGKEGTPSLRLAVNPAGGANIFMLDQEERARVNLLVTPEGQPFFHFLDQNERGRAGFGLSGDGEPKLFLCDAEGTPRATLHVAPDGTPSLDYAGPAPEYVPSDDPNEAP